MRLLLLTLTVLTMACDPCDAAARVHLERCVDGDQASCDWLGEHAPSGYCPG